LSFCANIIILFAAMLAAVLFTLAANRLWPVSRRYAQSDQVGWQLSVLESHLVNEQLWQALLSVQVATPLQINAHDHALGELSLLAQYRRTRLLHSHYELPGIFWSALLAGGVLTIVSVSIFGARQPWVHMLQVVSLTLLLTLVMLTIADVDKPFQGWVHVSDRAFQRALQTMREIH
jgi:hypothetical protein